MYKKNTKKYLVLNVAIFLIGALVFLVSICYVKNYGIRVLYFALIGAIAMLIGGFKIDELKKSKQIESYKEILTFLKEHSEEDR